MSNTLILGPRFQGANPTPLSRSWTPLLSKPAYPSTLNLARNSPNVCFTLLFYRQPTTYIKVYRTEISINAVKNNLKLNVEN